MLAPGDEPVNTTLWLAGLLHPPRAESLRRLIPHADAENGAISVEELGASCDQALSGAPPHDDATALRWLIAEDLRDLLGHAGAVAPLARVWANPEVPLTAALERATAALAGLGIDIESPALRVVDHIPAPYDHPPLAVASFDRSDAHAFGVTPGVYFRRDRALPGLGELALGHVLIHVALGQRSPERLGRGFEEGVAEVLGGLHAGAAGADPVAAELPEAAFAALRLTPSRPPERESFLDHVRGAALLHRNLGLTGLAGLVRGGRDAVKRSEAALARFGLDGELSASGPPDPALSARLDRLLLARARPQAVGPLAFLLARVLRAGRRVDDVARELGVPVAAARAAARELHGGAFVAILDDDGTALVDDLDLVLGAGTLRYRVPRRPPPPLPPLAAS